MSGAILAALLWAAPAPAQTGAPPAVSTATVRTSSAAVELPGLAEVMTAARHARSPAARRSAIRALRQASYRGEPAFKTLSDAMLHDLNNEVRQDAAAALLDYDGPETLAKIETFFKDELGDEARRVVCVALATAPAYGDNQSVTSLLTGLLAEDGSVAVRLAAVAGLAARQDASALGELQRASKKDKEASVRVAAAAAYRQLSQPVKMKAPKPFVDKQASYDAVKGKDVCPGGSGWCECSRPPLKTRPRCVLREECEHVYFNSYQHDGFDCTWNGELVK